MDKLRRSFRDSFRRRGSRGGSGGHSSGSGQTGGKPAEWQQDEAAVRAGTCSFNVKYLGCVEVYESRGMQVCEEALKMLRTQRRHPIRGVLYVSGDGLRVADAENKGLVVDQTVEKVSFCAPDRDHERGFAYICRDGTTRRWMCHGFHAVKESGERLSHAVGCAFAVCLEKKQKRDRDAAAPGGSSATSLDESSLPSSARSHESDGTGSEPSSGKHFRRNDFRRLTLPERLRDPQTARVSAPPPLKAAENPHAIARPRANEDLVFNREGSLRLTTTSETGGNEIVSPFKRSFSLRPSELTPSASELLAGLRNNHNSDSPARSVAGAGGIVNDAAMFGQNTRMNSQSMPSSPSARSHHFTQPHPQQPSPLVSGSNVLAQGLPHDLHFSGPSAGVPQFQTPTSRMHPRLGNDATAGFFGRDASGTTGSGMPSLPPCPSRSAGSTVEAGVASSNRSRAEEWLESTTKQLQTTGPFTAAPHRVETPPFIAPGTLSTASGGSAATVGVSHKGNQYYQPPIPPLSNSVLLADTGMNNFSGSSSLGSLSSDNRLHRADSLAAATAVTSSQNASSLGYQQLLPYVSNMNEQISDARGFPNASGDLDSFQHQDTTSHPAGVPTTNLSAAPVTGSSFTTNTPHPSSAHGRPQLNGYSPVSSATASNYSPGSVASNGPPTSARSSDSADNALSNISGGLGETPELDVFGQPVFTPRKMPQTTVRERLFEGNVSKNDLHDSVATPVDPFEARWRQLGGGVSSQSGPAGGSAAAPAADGTTQSLAPTNPFSDESGGVNI